MKRVLFWFAVFRGCLYAAAMVLIVSCEEIDKRLVEKTFDITCYSGDTQIFHGYVERVSTDGHTWFMLETKTEKSIRISGNCVVIRE